MKSYLILGIFLLFAPMVFGQEIRKVKITDVENIIKESKGPMIVNMWATWCVPCVEELPYFIKKAKADSIQLVMVSLDFKESFPTEMKKFMEKRKLDHDALWLDESNADYFCPKIDPKWYGAIPASLFINNATGYRKFREERITEEDLSKEIKDLLQQK